MGNLVNKWTKANLLTPIEKHFFCEVYVDLTTGDVYFASTSELADKRVSDWEKRGWEFVYLQEEEVKEELTEGVKHDTGKLPYDLIAPEMLEATARVLQFGASKYAPRNWEKGMDWSRVFSAMQRHTWAWWNGQDKDEETGFSHLDHALCCLMFLKAYEERQVGKDDRPNG